MDCFYRNLSLEIFKKWAYYQIVSHDELELEIVNGYTYKIHYLGKTACFVVWDKGYIEESIEAEDETLFYLHYEFYNFAYATDLFNRMIVSLLEDNREKKKKILLCCSGGMTTGYFAIRLNQFCKLNQLPYIIDANSIDKARNSYDDYAMILLAPQVHYRLTSLKEEYKQCKILPIEATTFATYDCAQLVKLIQKNIGDKDE